MTPAPIAATNASVAAADFADAMSTLASGVVLVTCRLADRPWGMTVTAFASVSAYPPTVLVSLGAGPPALARSRRRARSGSASSRESKRTSQSTERRRARRSSSTHSIEPRDRDSASPAIAQALAHLDCGVVEAVEAADHTVFFGHVHTVRRRRGGDPLLYHGRGYRSFVAPEPTTERSLEMCLELTARTEPGERLIALAEVLAEEVDGRASKHDREASFPFESLAAIKRSGYLAAPIPAELAVSE